jgi:hypothetical protein
MSTHQFTTPRVTYIGRPHGAAAASGARAKAQAGTAAPHAGGERATEAQHGSGQRGSVR